MNLLFYRYGSICEQDIILAFQELGLHVNQITVEITNKTIAPQESIRIVSEYLYSNPTDFIFSINFYPFLSEVCNIFHIPYLCWIVDSPVMELYTHSIKNKWNRIFLFDREIYNDIHNYNPDCIFHLPLATNVSEKQALISSSSDAVLSRYHCDLSFIGSPYTEKCAYDRLKPDNPYLIGYLNGIMNAQEKVYGYYFIDEILSDEIIRQFKQNFPNFYEFPFDSFLCDRTTLSQLYIGTKITVMERDHIMKLLSAKYSFQIYTGSDTTAYPKLINKGLASTHSEMPLIFHESTINLNTTAKSIRSGLPLRIWDILGSGGFCLTNYQSELPEFLSIGEDLDSYASLEELDEKAAYYLSHPNHAKEIAMHGLETVKNYHTYEIRLTQMLKLAFALY